MGNLGPAELILIMGIALIVFGPKKLPEIGKGIGSALREFNKARNDLMDLLHTEIDSHEPPRRTMLEADGDLHSRVASIRRGAVSPGRAIHRRNGHAEPASLAEHGQRGCPALRERLPRGRRRLEPTFQHRNQWPAGASSDGRCRCDERPGGRRKGLSHYPDWDP